MKTCKECQPVIEYKAILEIGETVLCPRHAGVDELEREIKARDGWIASLGKIAEISEKLNERLTYDDFTPAPELLEIGRLAKAESLLPYFGRLAEADRERLSKELGDLRKEYDEEVISHDIEEKRHASQLGVAHEQLASAQEAIHTSHAREKEIIDEPVRRVQGSVRRVLCALRGRGSAGRTGISRV